MVIMAALKTPSDGAVDESGTRSQLATAESPSLVVDSGDASDSTAFEEQIPPRRAELLLKPGSPFYDPQLAADLCSEGILKTNGRYPPLHDRRIEALVASGDLLGAIEASEKAAAGFPDLQRYAKSVEALRRAADGDAAGAASELMNGNDAVLMRIGEKLQG